MMKIQEGEGGNRRLTRYFSVAVKTGCRSSKRTIITEDRIMVGV